MILSCEVEGARMRHPQPHAIGDEWWMFVQSLEFEYFAPDGIIKFGWNL
jgi:hypothetical protein